MPIELPENLEQLSLEQASRFVIDQNTSVGYTPTEFINIVNRGVANNDLNIRITNLVSDITLLERLEKVIRQHPDAVMIEDLIAKRDDNFGLTEGIKRQAVGRAEYFNQKRFNI